VAASPEHGRANDALVKILAEALGLSRDAVRIVSGHSSRRKVVELGGLDEEEAGRRLEAAARR
jgi:uncharacterized protein YggU (UPF0235/DUF167 family)